MNVTFDPPPPHLGKDITVAVFGVYHDGHADPEGWRAARLVLCDSVGPLFVLAKSSTLKQALDACRNAGREVQSLGGQDCGRGDELQAPVVIVAISTIEQHSMHVEGELQGGTESLHNTKTSWQEDFARVGAPRLLANEAFDRAQEHGAHGREQAIVARNEDAQWDWQREPELAQRHLGHHMREEMLRQFCHATTDAGAADSPTLTAKSDDPLVLARSANDADKTSFDDSAIDDRFEFAPNETWQVDIGLGELLARRRQ